MTKRDDEAAVTPEALAKALGVQDGPEGVELRRYLGEVTKRVQSLVRGLPGGTLPTDPEERRAAAAQIKSLVDALPKTGTGTFRGIDLRQLSSGLRVFADWLADPKARDEDEVRTQVEALQKTLGYDPALEEEQRREEIRATVKSSLDQIFRGKKP